MKRLLMCRMPRILQKIICSFRGLILFGQIQLSCKSKHPLCDCYDEDGDDDDDDDEDDDVDNDNDDHEDSDDDDDEDGDDDDEMVP